MLRHLSYSCELFDPYHRSRPNLCFRTAIGEPTVSNNPLQISSEMMRALIDAGFIHSHLEAMYRSFRPHYSYQVQYDSDNIKPVAIRRWYFLRYEINIKAADNLCHRNTLTRPKSYRFDQLYHQAQTQGPRQHLFHEFRSLRYHGNTATPLHSTT